MSLPILNILRRLDLEPDPWQLDVVEGNHRRLLLNCCRQAGKSTAVALLSLVEALTNRDATILLLSRSLRQSAEMFRIIANATVRLNAPFLARKTLQRLEFTNGSRIVSLPCNADTVRGYSGIHMLVIDEAARVPDDLYRSVRPTLAASNGKLICLSTPNGKHGFFWREWSQGGPDWKRIEIPAAKVPRISPEFLAEERKSYGATYYSQEYECAFEAMEGLVYPNFAKCIVPEEPRTSASGLPSSPLSPPGERGGGEGAKRPATSLSLPKENPTGLPLYGGIDFGFRNPFAALWGHLDRAGILWLTGEHYASQKPLSYHILHLSKKVRWYADPAGASEIAELRTAGYAIARGNNAIRPGIMAVTARIETGTLKILPNACPNLLHEASLYRWSNAPGESETPIDEHNHALAALRYLISRLDKNKLGRLSHAQTEEEKATKAPRKWLSYRNEALWTRFC